MAYGRPAPADTPLSRLDARIKLLTLVVYMLVVFNVSSWAALGVCAGAALICSALARMRPRTVLRALVPLLTVLVFTVLMQLLYWNGTGTALAQLGPLAVTREALNASAVMMVRLVCVMAMSIVFMECTSADELTRTFTWLLSPFERLGLRTAGLSFALSVAFAFIPVLVDEFFLVKRAQESRLAEFSEGSARERLSAYQRVFAPILRNALRRADQLAEASVSRGLR